MSLPPPATVQVPPARLAPPVIPGEPMSWSVQGAASGLTVSVTELVTVKPTALVIVTCSV